MFAVFQLIVLREKSTYLENWEIPKRLNISANYKWKNLKL